MLNKPFDLSGVHPDLIVKIHAALAVMDEHGHAMRVCQGMRTTAQQQALYAQGRTAPGPRVTNCDGIKSRSNHQPHSDGFGHAVDCCFSGPKPFDIHQPWALYGEALKAQGLIWGGDFKTLADLDHAELPEEK